MIIMNMSQFPMNSSSLLACPHFLNVVFINCVSCFHELVEESDFLFLFFISNLFSFLLTFFLPPFPGPSRPSLHRRPFTVYSNTTGCSDALGMKSRLISDGQISATSSFRTWGIDAFTWHPRLARLDKQGKTNAWSPAHNNRSEWIEVSRKSVTASGSADQMSLNV